MKNYYEILEVNPKASKEVIDKVYKLLAKKYHPDTQPEDKKEWAEEKFKELNNAYEIISDEEKRKIYDEETSNEFDEQVLIYLKKENDELKEKIENLQNQINTQSTVNQNYTSQNDFNQNSQASYYSNFNPFEYYKKAQEYYSNVAPSYTYKKTSLKTSFLRKFKDILAFLLAISIMLIIFFVLIKIPFIHDYLAKTFENIPIIKNIFN